MLKTKILYFDKYDKKNEGIINNTVKEIEKGKGENPYSVSVVKDIDVKQIEKNNNIALSVIIIYEVKNIV